VPPECLAEDEAQAEWVDRQEAHVADWRRLAARRQPIEAGNLPGLGIEDVEASTGSRRLLGNM
jgi:hypothetical protein